MAQSKLQAVGLRMEYYQPRTGGRLLALDNVNLAVEEGEFVTIVGPSGCGKTTFINIADGLLKQTGGKILLDGKEVTGPDGQGDGVSGPVSYALADGVEERSIWTGMPGTRRSSGEGKGAQIHQTGGALRIRRPLSA